MTWGSQDLCEHSIIWPYPGSRCSDYAPVPGSRWKSLKSELAFPTAQLFQAKSLQNVISPFPWGEKVNKFGVFVSLIFFFLATEYCPFFFPFFFWYLHLAQWINFVPELICNLGCFRGNGREQASQPSCCSWAVLLYSCCLNDVQLFIHGTISDMVTLLLSSLMWSYLFSEGSGFGTSVVLRSPFKTNSRRQKAKSRSGRQRGQGKQGREQHSSSISGSCWVSRVTGAVTWQCASVFLVATHSQGPAVSWI